MYQITSTWFYIGLMAFQLTWLKYVVLCVLHLMNYVHETLQFDISYSEL